MWSAPYEMFTGIKVNISNMHLFEIICYVYIQNPNKLDDRMRREYLENMIKVVLYIWHIFPKK